MTSLHCDVEMKARSTEVEACGAGRYGERENYVGRRKRSCTEANGQRSTSNAEATEVRLKAGAKAKEKVRRRDARGARK